MSERYEVMAALRDARVATAIQWAFRSAVDRTLDDYSEDAGHDAAWLGSTRFVYLRDRLDRVFHCGRYEITGDEDESVGVDLLHAQLSSLDISTMPKLSPRAVVRSDLHGSPGWAFGDCRFLLASANFGQIDCLPWPRKSETKRRVARQADLDPPMSLFDELDAEEASRLMAVLAQQSLDMRTYVVAHSLDPITSSAELVFGKPRLNDHGGAAWHWVERLDETPVAQGETGVGVAVPPPGPVVAGVADADVRLRPASSGATGVVNSQ